VTQFLGVFDQCDLAERWGCAGGALVTNFFFLPMGPDNTRDLGRLNRNFRDSLLTPSCLFVSRGPSPFPKPSPKRGLIGSGGSGVFLGWVGFRRVGSFLRY